MASGPPYRTPVIQRVQQARRARRLALYQQTVAWQQLGMTTPSIAQQTGLSPRSVRRWLAEGTFPEPRQRRRRPSLIDPYEAYILQRWQHGCRNGLQIWREIAAQGYSGSSRALRNYLARLPGAGRQAATTSTHWRARTQKFERLGRGIEQDYVAVVAGLTLPYSNDHVA